MSRIVPVTVILAMGCWATPPAPALPYDLGGCHPGAYATLTEHACDSDADCLLCATVDGCALVPKTRVDLTGEPCPRPTDPSCDGMRASCCEGRCVQSLGPPPL